MTEPDTQPKPDVLDLVRQYGVKKVEALSVGEYGGDDEPYEHEAAALFARIEAEVQRLRVDRVTFRESARVAGQQRDEALRQRDVARDVVDDRRTLRDEHAAALAEVQRLRDAADSTRFLAVVRKLEAEHDEVLTEVERLNAEAERVTNDLVKACDERDSVLNNARDLRRMLDAQQERADDAVESLDRHREAWEAEVERLKAAAPGRTEQARDYYGVPLWIHGCGDVRRQKGQPERRCDCFSPDGPWRPLLVATDAPQQDEPFDENTLLKVYEALGRADLSAGQARDVITDMQNHGILFRERSAPPRREGPLVLTLTLPEVPDGTVALTGVESGRRYPFHEESGGWRNDDDGAPWKLSAVLHREHPHGVTVELAPPREPRTWPKLDEVTDPPRMVEVKPRTGFIQVWRRPAESRDFERVADFTDETKDRTLRLEQLRYLGDVREMRES